MTLVDPEKDNNVDLRDIRICKKKGGTIEETSIVDGLDCASYQQHLTTLGSSGHSRTQAQNFW